MTDDHKPERDGERERIFASNGAVYREVDGEGNDVGPYRVWANKGPMLGLAMSRSLGDRLAHNVGVIPDPEVRPHGNIDNTSSLLLGTMPSLDSRLSSA